MEKTKEDYREAKIIKATPLLFGNTYEPPFHENMVGQIILVKEVTWQSAYYEVSTGESILKKDVILL